MPSRTSSRAFRSRALAALRATGVETDGLPLTASPHRLAEALVDAGVWDAFIKKFPIYPKAITAKNYARR